MQRRLFLSQTAAAAGALATAGRAGATDDYTPSIVVEWNRLAGQSVQLMVTPVTIAARAYAMLNEAIYNAWAHYDPTAAFTLPELTKRKLVEWNDSNRRIAISHAAHGVLSEFFPNLIYQFDALLHRSVADASPSQGGSQADNVGREVAWRVIQSRDNDGANMRGDLAPGFYSDYTGYQSVNTPDQINDLTRWQPLRLPNAAGTLVVQRFLTPHWGLVRPFALSRGSQFRPALDPLAPLQSELDELIRLSAELDDRTKALGDFFAQNPGAVTPPGQWLQVAEQVAAIDGNGLKRDVKLFFAVAQAGLDASIAAWDAKRAYDQARPISVIPVLYRGQTILAWGGPGLGTQPILGENWITWQRPVNRTPPFPDFVSGHSTFSAACATAIARLRGSDSITLRATVPAGAFRTDPGLPLADVNFVWYRLSEMADAAGFSRRVTGIHWARSDLAGRALGRSVGSVVARKAMALFGLGGY